MNLSIHTFEITYKDSYKNYEKLYYAINRINTSRCPRKEYSYTSPGGIELTCISQTFTCLNKRGINRIYFYKHMDKQENQIALWGVRFIINPRILLGYKEHIYTEIIKPDDLSLIPEALHSLLQEFVPDFPDISKSGKITRIDYCTNLWFQTQDEADEYFSLLKKYHTPAKFKPLTYYDEQMHRKIPRKGEITVACKSYELSIYQKKYQLLNSGYDYPVEDIQNSTGQLRIELRLRRKPLYSLKKALSLADEALLFIHIPNKVLQNLLKKLSVMYGTGDFCRLADAKNLVKHSSYIDKTKNAMLEILENTNEKRTLNCYRTTFDNELLKKNLKRFNELDISPITLPFRSIHKNYPSLLSYITGVADDYLKK